MWHDGVRMIHRRTSRPRVRSYTYYAGNVDHCTLSSFQSRRNLPNYECTLLRFFYLFIQNQVIDRIVVSMLVNFDLRGYES